MLDSSKPEAGEKLSETGGQGTGDVTLGCELGCESESIEHERGICGIKPEVCDATKCEADDGSEVRCAFNREYGDKLDTVRWDSSKTDLHLLPFFSRTLGTGLQCFRQDVRDQASSISFLDKGCTAVSRLLTRETLLSAKFFFTARVNRFFLSSIHL